MVISSGVVLDLSGNTNSTLIAPGGGVVIYGGTTNGFATEIMFSSGGGSSGTRSFVGCVVSAAEVTNLGQIVSATYTLNTSATYYVETRSGSSEGVSEVNGPVTSALGAGVILQGITLK